MNSFLILFFSLTLISSCKRNNSSKTDILAPELIFKQHKNLKLGFTTQLFAEVAPVSLVSSKQFVDYAASSGFTWLELRDPDAILTMEECKAIADYAKEKGVEVAYAIQKGLLDADFWITFEKGIKKAAFFHGPKTFRALAGGEEFNTDTTKTGWDAAEMSQIVKYADSAALIAQKNGLQFVIENGTEPLYGKEAKYFGFADIIDRTREEVGWQFDTANPFSVSRVHSSSDTVMAFMLKHINKLSYIHLKSAQKGMPQRVLTNNPIAFEEVFQALAKHKILYVAIELQAVDDEDQAYENLERSVGFLREKYLN
jgi:sugar phosphate isomerase/epimerase